MAWLRIILLATLLATGYGIAHDTVTVRICLEYFTVGHPPILGGTENPWLLALGWGVLATWWMGAALGLFVAAAARLGTRLPSLTWRELVRPMLWVLAGMAVASLAFGILGNRLATAGTIELVGFVERVPPDRHVAFLTCLWAHVAAYCAGALGGLVVVITTLLRRNRLARA